MTLTAVAAGAAVAAVQSGLDQTVIDRAVSPAPAMVDGAAAAPDVTGPAIGLLGDGLGGPVVGADLARLAKADLQGRRAAAIAAGAPSAVVATDGDVVASPVLGQVTSPAGPRWGTAHNGVDIANDIGTPVFAVADGVVEESGPATGFGLWVVIRHSGGLRSIYGHINRSFVAIGQQVPAGARIAEVGNRGRSTGPHLHLELQDRSGTPMDPAQWLRRHGVTAGR